MIKVLLIAALLTGSVSNQYGRVGLRIGSSGNVSHVYIHSPASGLIYVGDRIIEADGKKGHSLTDGMAGTTAHLKVKRCGKILEFDIKRVPKNEVYD